MYTFLDTMLVAEHSDYTPVYQGMEYAAEPEPLDEENPDAFYEIVRAYIHARTCARVLSSRRVCPACRMSRSTAS